MMDNFTDRLLEVAHRSLKIEKKSLCRDTRLSAVGDSLDFVDFLSDVEASFGIDINDAQLEDINTVGDLIDLVDHICRTKAPQSGSVSTRAKIQ